MPKVILIEDDTTMLSLLRTIMEMEGYQVKEAGPEQDIIPFLHQERPDLVLLDVHLKEVNGLDILEKIRRENGLSGTRVLMSSGMDFKETCLESGADDFILKPYMPDELLGKMEKLLQVKN